MAHKRVVEGILPGLSDSPKLQQKARVKGNPFAFVADAFEEKSPSGIGDLKPKRRDSSQSAAETEGAAPPVQMKENVLPIVNSPVEKPEQRDVQCIKYQGNMQEIDLSNRVVHGPQLLIKNGKIFNADQFYDADIYVENGVIRHIAKTITGSDVPTIDAQGKFVIPGGVDLATYFSRGVTGVETAEDFNSGTKSALSGGTTTVVDLVVCPKGSSPLQVFLQHKLEAASACCDYVVRVALTEFNSRVASDMSVLVKDHGVGCFQFFVSYPRVAMLADDELFDALHHCRQLGVLVMIRAENGHITAKQEQDLLRQGVRGPEGHYLSRSEESEAEAVGRVLAIAGAASCPVVFAPIGCLKAAQVLSAARKRGKFAFGYCTSATLALKKDGLFNSDWSTAAAHVTSPPLRDFANSAGLQHLLTAGDLDAVASEHCPYRTDQKAIGKDNFTLIPEGMNGVAERMAVLWKTAVTTGQLDPCQFVNLTSSGPAKLLNIYPRKGRIEVGSDADMVIWNPAASTTHNFVPQSATAGTKNVFSSLLCPFVGPEVTINHGRVVTENGAVTGAVESGAGQYLNIVTFAPVVYSRLLAKEKVTILRPVVRDENSDPASPGSSLLDLTLTSTSAAVVDPTIHAPATQEQSDEAATAVETAQPGSSGTFHSRPTTRSGQRNLLDSGFTLGGAQIDDDRPIRSGIRTCQPPGGSSNKPIW